MADYKQRATLVLALLTFGWIIGLQEKNGWKKKRAHKTHEDSVILSKYHETKTHDQKPQYRIGNKQMRAND